MMYARNRRVTHDYQLHERYEAGMVLEGWEVKGIVAGEVQLAGAYVIIKRNEAWLLGCNIKPPASLQSCNPTRSRKLLLKGVELRKLAGKIKQTGLALVIVDIHRTHGKIKATIALAKGKKEHDKRQAKKEREWSRSQGR